MKMNLEMLNENQRDAVNWNAGPLLVLAGPGSGKTQVLTLRLARLIEENEFASVLALTFTNKAAAEMRERTEQLLGRCANRARLCTFHSFAADLLRQHGSHLELRPDFTLLTQDEDRIEILEEAIAKLPTPTNAQAMDYRNLLGFVDRLFAESYDGGRVATSRNDLPDWVPLLHRGYCEALASGNRLDFGSLLHFARVLLRKRPFVARVVGLSWNYICVDEFQDTNKAQYDLLRLLTPSRKHNLFVVGDDDQIIYEWRGASPRRLYDLQRDYDLELIQLPQCYRCPAPIIKFANNLIKNNAGRISGKAQIESVSDVGLDSSDVRFGSFPSPEKEAAFIPQDIHCREIRPSDCVVLGRNTKLLEVVASALNAAGVEAQLGRRKTEFESPLVRVQMEALRLANARHDRNILRRLCLAWGSLTGSIIEPEDVAAAAALVGGHFLRAWASAAAETNSGVAASVANRIQSDLVDSLAFPSVVNWFLDRGWESWGGGDDSTLTSDEVKVWQTIHDEIVKEYDGNLTLNAYLHKIDLSSKSPDPGPSAVRCYTVHGAKGLEFKHVYLVGMAQEVFPSYYALRHGPHSKELEEERRNCFVAITRAEITLTLTWAQRYFGYPKQPSQFLSEMGIETSAPSP